MTAKIIRFPTRFLRNRNSIESRIDVALHPEETWTRSLLAGLDAYETQNLADATNLLRASLDEAERFGTENFRTAISLRCLAEVCVAAGRYGDARPLQTRALTIDRKLLGPTHVEIAHHLNNLGVIYHAMGNHAAAMPLFRTAFAIQAESPGRSSLDTCVSLRNLGLLFQDMEDYGAAVHCFTRILETLRDAGIADPLLVAEIHDDRGITHLANDALDDAQTDFETARQIRQGSAGPESLEMVPSLLHIALLRTRQRAFAAACRLYDAALAILDGHPGRAYQERTICLENLALLHRAQGRTAEAERLCRRALDDLEAIVGPDHPDLVGPLNSLAAVCREQGRLKETESLRRRSGVLLARALGPDRAEPSAPPRDLAPS